MDFHIFLAWIPPISSWSRHPATKNQEVMQEFVQSHLVSTLNPIHEAGSCENAPIEGFQKPHSKHKYISWYVTVFKEGWLSVYSLYGVIMELYGVIWSYPVIQLSTFRWPQHVVHWATGLGIIPEVMSLGHHWAGSSFSKTQWPLNVVFFKKIEVYINL